MKLFVKHIAQTLGVLVMFQGSIIVSAQVASDTTKLTTDTTILKTEATGNKKKTKTPKPPYVHQVRVGVDLGAVIYNLTQPNRSGYEFFTDYALRKNTYLNAGAGFGNGHVDYDHLNYTTNSFFVRLGVDKSLLDQLSNNDFDIAFIGAAYGLSIGQRSMAEYLVPSPFGPDLSGSKPAQRFVLHWGELTAGVRVEFWQRIYAGWNIRAKFLLNPGVFEELAPNYVAGYGKADKATSFGFNFYLAYAFQWGGQ